MRKGLFISAICFLAILPAKIFSQESGESRFHLMASPQYLINDGLRFDLDFKMKGDRWLIVTPYIYLKDNAGLQDTSAYDNSMSYSQPEYVMLKGAGLGIAQRHVLNQEFPKKPHVYMEYGVLYRFYDFQMNGDIWEKYTENGLPMQHLVQSNYDIKMHNMGLNFQIGVQQQLFNHIILEGYVGCGLRYNSYDKPEGSLIKFNSSMIDYGYTGIMVTGGIKIGVAL